MVVFAMILLLGMASLAVDTGYMFMAKNELQNIADAAALAATRQLGVIYEGMTYEEMQGWVLSNPKQLIDVAIDVASKNKAAGMNITINEADVRIGQWDAKTHLLTPGLTQPDAVKVTVRRDGNANGPVTTFFARILGVNAADVSVDATAALTAQSTAGEGDIELPVGISRKWFEKDEFCNQPIKFYPTGTLDGCAGWHTFTNWPASSAELKTILTQMESDTFDSPPTTAGETDFVFVGGNIAALFDYMQALYDAKKDPITGRWETLVVVYDSDDCSNPTGNITVAGFATAIITGVNGPSDDPPHTIFADVKCENVEFGRGSGGDYGTKGSIAGLVE